MEWPLKLQRRSSGEKSKPKKLSGLKTQQVSNSAANEAFALKIEIESPPLCSYGPPEDSSGALLSGILSLIPRITPIAPEQSFDIAKLEMKLFMDIVTKRPIGHNCVPCSTKSKVVNTWTFIRARRSLQYNKGAPHSFPFSFLVPGNFPATTQSALATVSYRLVAEAIPAAPIPTVTLPSPTDIPMTLRSGLSTDVIPTAPTPPTTVSPSVQARSDTAHRTLSFKPITLSYNLHLSRSILPSVEPRTSHRIFPPTQLAATINLPNVFYPGSKDNEVEITVEGLSVPDTKLRWSLRKFTWRIDEISKVVSAPCPQHAHKLPTAERKGLLYEDKRTLGAGDMKQGWKTDYAAGKAECLLRLAIAPESMAACDVDSVSGVLVSHDLVIECIVAEEMLHTSTGHARRSAQYVVTGSARVLRMVFPMIVTERGGMGISWDEEIPPRYEDVAWNAPPSFSQEDLEAGESQRDSMEELETVEGVRRPHAYSPGPSGRPSSSGSAPFVRLSRTDSDVSSVSF